MLDKNTPVIILCGGKGTRIADITGDIPKPMVPIGNYPILWHIMKIYSQFGYKNFILTLGHKGWAIKDYFLNYKYKTADIEVSFNNEGRNIKVLSDDDNLDWSITLAETGEDTLTGQRVAMCAKYVTTANFMVTYGDGLANIDLAALTKFHQEQNNIATVTSVRPTSRFGNIVINPENKVTEFNEKQHAGGGTINGGFFVFKKEFMNIASQFGNVMLEREPMDELVKQNELSAFEHTGFWEPMDTSREYNMLNMLWNNNKAPWKIW
ncbi:MAG: sugar phosphate nucleotidyltransferase [Chitinophagales bacterium]